MSDYTIVVIQIVKTFLLDTLIRMAKIQTTDNIKCWIRCRAVGTLVLLLVGMQSGTVLLEDSLEASYKTMYILIIHFSSCVLRYLLKWIKTYVHRKTCTGRFIAALFMVAKIWKQPRYPSAGEWLNKLIHADNGLLFSAKMKWAIKLWKEMERKWKC